MGLSPAGTVPIETIYIGSLFEIEETVSTTAQAHSAKETVSERFGRTGVADFSVREGMSFPQQRESTGVAGFSPRKETVSAIVQTNRPKQTVSDGVAGFSLRYYHPDHLGSSNIITDESGNQVQLLEYTPYGTLSRSEGLSL